MNKFIYFRNGKDRMQNETDADALLQMSDEAEEITFRTFACRCDWKELAANLGYDKDLPLSKDWSVRFLKSKFKGHPCYILDHTECEFIFLEPSVVKSLMKNDIKDLIDPLEWKRATSYGPNQQVDPRLTRF